MYQYLVWGAGQVYAQREFVAMSPHDVHNFAAASTKFRVSFDAVQEVHCLHHTSNTPSLPPFLPTVELERERESREL
jgi:hypothetical protein